MHAVYLLILLIIFIQPFDCDRSSSDCRLKYAGIYYLSLNDTTSGYNWYSLAHLDSDGSTMLVGSDQQSLQASSTIEAIAQPYSDVLGKWTCQKLSKTIKIRITAYNFEYPTSNLPQGNYINVAKFYLKLNKKTGEITGNATGQFFKVTTKLLGKSSAEIQQDSIVGPLSVNVDGYSVERYNS